ncbi:MAG: PKD domain-containing protein [Bacteroidota bacterium]
MQAQNQSTISGYVTDPNTGFALSGYPVEIESTNPNYPYSDTKFTNANGYYVDSVPVFPGVQFDYKVSVLDSCNNFTTIDSFVSNGFLVNNLAQVDFQVCAPGSGQGGNCDASFTQTLAPGMPGNPAVSVWELEANTVSPNYTYEWFVDGQSAGTGSSLTYTLNANISQVCLTVTDSTPAGFCQDTQCDSIYNQQPPNAPCDAGFVILNKNGLDIDLLDNSQSPSGNHNVTFHMGDGTVYNSASVSHTYAQAGTYTILQLIDDSTCIDSNEVTLTFYGNGGGNTNCFAAFQAVDQGNTTVEFFDGSNYASNPNYNSTIDFGDGNSATFTGASLTHTYANPGTYVVCISTSNGTCSDTFCDSVVVSGPVTLPVIYNIYGIVSTASFTTHAPVNDARVYLIQFDSTNNTLTAIDSTDLTMADSGYYSFQVNPGIYYVKTALLPSATDYNSYIPTYYGNSTQWLYASPINAFGPNPWSMNNITLIAGSNPGGPGFVGGTLQSGANKVSDTDISVENVEVVLFDAATNEVVAFTRSDALGNFSLNVPYGTYRLHAEVLGIVTADRYITLDADNPSAEDQDITLGSKSTSRSDDQALISDFAVFPNPARQTATLAISSEATGTANVSLRDNTGRLVYSQQFTVNGNAQQTLPVAELPNGLYHVTLELNGTTQHNKLIVQH